MTENFVKIKEAVLITIPLYFVELIQDKYLLQKMGNLERDAPAHLDKVVNKSDFLKRMEEIQKTNGEQKKFSAFAKQHFYAQQNRIEIKTIQFTSRFQKYLHIIWHIRNGREFKI